MLRRVWGNFFLGQHHEHIWPFVSHVWTHQPGFGRGCKHAKGLACITRAKLPKLYMLHVFCCFWCFAHISSTCVAAYSEIPSNVASAFRKKKKNGPKHGQLAQTTTFNAF